MSALRWSIGCAILLLLFAAGAAVALFLYALQPEPLVPRSAPADYSTVAEGKAFVKRIKIQIEEADTQGTTLAVTEGELDRLALLGSHTFKWASADVEIDGATLDAKMSVQLPQNPFGQYLNLAAQVGSSSSGFGIDQLSVGPLRFTGRWLLPLAARMMDALLGDTQASQLLAGVTGMQIEGDMALLSVSPPPDAKANFKQAVRTLQTYRWPDGEAERVTHYYDLLAKEGDLPDVRTQSLSEYLVPLMREASRRSADSSAVTENRAAIWALVIYFSDGGFETLIGKLVSSQRELVWAPYDVCLAQRPDLRQHFLTSAGIALASQQGISIAAGEFKELLDSGSGGSGFSFVDLAADRAGIQFVTLATAGEDEARQLQQQLAGMNGEDTFFPDTSGLLEGLSDEQFRARYGDMESARYLEQVAKIDKRIARLPIYSQSAQSSLGSE
jgi:hypothetical protein